MDLRKGFYAQVFENNKKWIADKLAVDPSYFEHLAKGQSPQILYIGCSDSRITAEELMGAQPGDVFVHRNIANLVGVSDLSALSVIEYAIARRRAISSCMGSRSYAGLRMSMADTAWPVRNRASATIM